MDKRLFPENLLLAPIEERIRYFKSITVSHPVFEQAYNDLLDGIYNGMKNKIILVYGPSGVGKTKLIEKIKERIINDNYQVLKENQSIIPWLSVEAVPPDTGSFNWKDFYYRALVQAEEPLIDYKIDIEKMYGHKQKLKKVKVDVTKTLMRSLENVLIYRNPYAFIIDEAQHITMTISGRNMQNQINLLKSMANRTNVPIMLTGSYELITYRNINEQTIRRGWDIHLRRYKAEKEEDLEAFINVLLAFQKHLPVEIEPDLIENWDYFYSHTIGCIGILKDWFDTTYQIKLSNNHNLKTLCIEDFKKYELSADKCLKLLHEADIGESKLKHSKGQEAELYNSLGLMSDIPIEVSKEDEKEVEEVEKKVKSKRNVGERNPKRDTVGSSDF